VDFALFLLVTAILFIRPTDFVPGLEGMQLYLVAIVPCILLSWHRLVPQVSLAGLRERPVLVFGIGILLAAVLSAVRFGQYQDANDYAVESAKILLFYLALTRQTDSPPRLHL